MLGYQGIRLSKFGYRNTQNAFSITECLVIEVLLYFDEFVSKVFYFYPLCSNCFEESAPKVINRTPMCLNVYEN